MSNKRKHDQSSEEIHTRHKKLRDEDGIAKRVDSNRFNDNFQNQPFGANINNDSDPFGMGMGMRINNYPLPQSDDDNDIDSPSNVNMNSSKSKSNDNTDTELGLLLYELASLDVGNNNNNNNNNQSLDQPQTCPICSIRVSLKDFADHVHGCLDAMDEGDLNDMRTQLERDSDFAKTYARQHGYLTEFSTVCPVCNVELSVGMSMNEHVNLCLDASMKADEMKKNNNSMNEYDDDDEDDDIIRPNTSNNNNNKGSSGVMSREQMISCAKKLQTLRQGSEEFDKVLDMFGALGFNKTNVKSVLNIEKNQKNKNNNNNNQNVNNMNYSNNMNNNPFNNNNNNNYNVDLSPIAEEDIDLNRNQKPINFMNNDNRNNQQQQRQQMNNDNQQYIFDDDDL